MQARFAKVSEACIYLFPQINPHFTFHFHFPGGPSLFKRPESRPCLDKGIHPVRACMCTLDVYSEVREGTTLTFSGCPWVGDSREKRPWGLTHSSFFLSLFQRRRRREVSVNGYTFSSAQIGCPTCMDTVLVRGPRCPCFPSQHPRERESRERYFSFIVDFTK